VIKIFFRKTYKEFIDFVSNAKDELIILSPFIKLEPLKLLLEKVKPGVKVIVVARWKLIDLLFGSSDIIVFKYLRSLNHDFYTHKKIHLKVIVKDKKNILIGSANITGSGLGLFDSSNIEAISINSLDEKYLPSVYSIIRESELVDQTLVKKISKKLEAYQNVKSLQKKIGKELEKAEKSIFIKLKKNILVYDFLLTPTPDLFVESIKTKNINDEIKHDLRILRLGDSVMNLDILKQSFLKSDAYLWQKKYIIRETLFGMYSEILHNALVDNPKPYRKKVKELVSNMFNWTTAFSRDFFVKEYNHTKSLIQRK